MARRASDGREIQFGDLAHQCENCTRRNPWKHGTPRCAAFPKGRPDDVRFGIIDHRQPYEGDNGIRFEAADPADRERQYWNEVMTYGLPRFRCFRRPLTVEEVEVELENRKSEEWTALKEKVAPGDEIWPFRYPRIKRYWGGQCGYVVLRKGVFVGGLVTKHA